MPGLASNPATPSSFIHRRTASKPATVDLPARFRGIVPLCARPCIAAYIADQFDCVSSDISCLCSEYSSEGFTLGEIGIFCLASCTETLQSTQSTVYNICGATTDAVQATHSILTIPPTAPTSSTLASQKTHGEASHTAAPSAVPDFASGPLPTSSAAPVTSALSSSPTATNTTGSRAAGSTTLTTAQAVGISIAAMGAVILAIAGFYLITYIRRRKAQQEERHSYDFVDEAPPRFSPSNYGYVDPREPVRRFTMPILVPSAEKHKTEWPGQQQGDAPSHVQGVPEREHCAYRSPSMDRSTSPESCRSGCSMRTISQLLPDRPGDGYLQTPSKSTNMLSSPVPVVEEERRPQLPRSLMPGLPPHPAAFKVRGADYQDQHTMSSAAMGPPNLSLMIPRQVDNSESIELSSGIPLLPPPPAVLPGTACRHSGDSEAESSSNSLLNYYANSSGESPDNLNSSTPIEDQSQVRRPPPTAIIIVQPSIAPRAVRISTASEASHRTSFESTDPDEPTPPEEDDKRLTPVAESPIAAIRYPKIPRSSNQSVPRSPQYGLPKAVKWTPGQTQKRDCDASILSPDSSKDFVPEPLQHSRHSPLSSESTLAAKRRGHTAAHDLELGLRIKDSAYGAHPREIGYNPSTAPHEVPPVRRPVGPLKGYGRVANKPQHDESWPLPPGTALLSPGSAALRSPLWEPKLTPRREGDDLYLSVSVATPLGAHFRQ